jgi:hypothetical protein
MRKIHRISVVGFEQAGLGNACIAGLGGDIDVADQLLLPVVQYGGMQPVRKSLKVLRCAVRVLMMRQSHPKVAFPGYSTVTDFARFRGLSTSVPRASAVW